MSRIDLATCTALLALGGCLSAPATPAAGSDDDSATSSSTEDTDAPMDPSGSSGGSTGGPADGSDGGSGGDSGGSTGGTGEDVQGYSPDVLDALDLPFPPYDYANPDLPPHFEAPRVQAFNNTPTTNPTTNDGATLGRVLFYDTSLSANETTACASCHRQELAFTDDTALSLGFDGGETGRNSMHLANVAYYERGRFFWDERAATLEEQVLMPIQDPVEMGMTLEDLLLRVEAQPYYPELFERAFGDEAITTDRISKALAQYVRSIVSYQSRYDEGLAQVGVPVVDFPNFTPQENLGRQLFFSPQGNCAVCHLTNDGPPGPGTPPPNDAIFFVRDPVNNGLDATTTDEGVGDGAFKSPSLRNIALSGPFMHDGRFATLEQVVAHYDSGVQPHPNLDPRLRGPDGQPQRLNLTAEERAAIVAFLGTLTDEALLEDPKYADPFR
jgi:cytochrome c peroxidase